MTTRVDQPRVSTGVEGLDTILDGGLLARRAYLIRGGPGTGKTTLGLHFLMQGVAQGEPATYVSLEEPEQHIRADAAARGFDLKGISFLDLSPTSEFFSSVGTYDVFSPADVERHPVTQQLVSMIEAVRPTRVFIDPVTQLRYLAPDVFQFRRQVLSLIRFLIERDATVLFSSENSPEAPDDDVQFISDGVIHFEATAHGPLASVRKLRGSGFRSGSHAMRLTGQGIEVYPRLVADAPTRTFSRETVPSGLPYLDELLHGGLERGTIAMVSGPSGVGKTTLAMQFMKEAAGRGERSVVYTFEEEIAILAARCNTVGIPASAMIDRGTLSLVKIEPLQLSPDEFASEVQREVARGARIVMIDSVAGFRLSLRGESPVERLHTIAKYLQNQGVLVILVVEVENIVNGLNISELGLSYLADSILFMRYMERRSGGSGALEVRRTIGVLKKRLSDFDKTLREIEITGYGVKINRPMGHISSILGGVPTWDEGTGGTP